MANPQAHNGQTTGAAPAARYINLPPGPLGQRMQKAIDDLKSVSTAATGWAATISALVGISTILGLLKGNDALAKLSVPTQILFTVTFFLALALAVASVVLAALASQGTPKYGFDDPVSVLKATYEQLNAATRQLLTSRVLALIAVIFLALAILFSLFDWFGSPPTGTTVLAVQRSGSVVCGKLTKVQAGQVSLMSNGQTLTLKDVVSFTIVPSCPK